jgi:DNA 3'-phosphatase
VIVDKPDKIAEVKMRFAQMQEAVGIPMTFMAALGPGSDKNRKPDVGMYEYLEKNLNGGKRFTKLESFICGVHAGRSELNGAPKDCYDIDINFAKALDLKFYTPELYFFGKDERLETIKALAQEETK